LDLLDVPTAGSIAIYRFPLNPEVGNRPPRFGDDRNKSEDEATGRVENGAPDPLTSLPKHFVHSMYRYLDGQGGSLVD
jgi:hypothetical protein